MDEENFVAPFDVRGRSTFHDDPLFAPLVHQFVQALPTRVAAIRQAQCRSDWMEISILAHRLSGASGSYGFEEMGNIAARIEELSHEPVKGDALAQSIAAFEFQCEMAVRWNSAKH